MRTKNLKYISGVDGKPVELGVITKNPTAHPARITSTIVSDKHTFYNNDFVSERTDPYRSTCMDSVTIQKF